MLEIAKGRDGDQIYVTLSGRGAQSQERRGRIGVQDAPAFRYIEHVTAHAPGELLGTKNRHYW